MTILDAIREARDVPDFLDRDVDREILLGLMEAVRFTPSAANTQPWEVYLVSDPDRKRRLDTCIPDPMMTSPGGGRDVSEAPAAVVMAMDVKRAGARYGELGKTLLGVQDTAVAVGNLRLLAAERGLHTRWIREVRPEDVGRALGLPRQQRAVALVLVGYARSPAGEVPVLPVEAWLHAD